MFDPANGPPFTAEFIVRYRAAQLERNRRIPCWAEGQQRALASPSQWLARLGLDDFTFLAHGTSSGRIDHTLADSRSWLPEVPCPAPVLKPWTDTAVPVHFGREMYDAAVTADRTVKGATPLLRGPARRAGHRVRRPRRMGRAGLSECRGVAAGRADSYARVA